MDIQKKMGRPTADPKPIKITVRINQETKDILDTYCKKHNKATVEGVRDGINYLAEK